MSPQNKMTCPGCGDVMNHHAEKLVSASPGEPGYDNSLGGAIEESHACPGCGAGASRRPAS